MLCYAFPILQVSSYDIKQFNGFVLKFRPSEVIAEV